MGWVVAAVLVLVLVVVVAGNRFGIWQAIMADDEQLLDPDCRDGKHGSCVGGPCECECHDQADDLEAGYYEETGAFDDEIEPVRTPDGPGDTATMTAITGFDNGDWGDTERRKRPTLIHPRLGTGPAAAELPARV